VIAPRWLPHCAGWTGDWRPERGNCGEVHRARPVFPPSVHPGVVVAGRYPSWPARPLLGWCRRSRIRCPDGVPSLWGRKGRWRLAGILGSPWNLVEPRLTENTGTQLEKMVVTFYQWGVAKWGAEAGYWVAGGREGIGGQG